jgi:hypothetical protein
VNTPPIALADARARCGYDARRAYCARAPSSLRLWCSGEGAGSRGRCFSF